MLGNLLFDLIIFIMVAPTCVMVGGFVGWVYALSKNLNGPKTLKMLVRGVLAGIVAGLVITILLIFLIESGG